MEHEHQTGLDGAARTLPQDSLLCDLAGLFHIFGDSTRIKILRTLFECDMCVCAIAELLGMQQSAISHQLRILKQSRLVGSRREGRAIYYFICDDHVKAIINEGMEHIRE